MSAQDHWKDSNNSSDPGKEMEAWNVIAGILIAGEIPTLRNARRIMVLASKAGYSEADGFIRETYELLSENIHAEDHPEISRLIKAFQNYKEGKYFQAIAMSESVLRANCLALDPDTQAQQRRMVADIAESARNAFLSGREARLNPVPSPVIQSTNILG